MNTQVIRGEIILDTDVFTQQYAINHNGYALVFDTETHSDLSQKAKIGVYAYYDMHTANETIHTIEDYKNIPIIARGMVLYDLDENERKELAAYCKETGIKCISSHTFIHKLLFPAMLQGTMLVGHNIPFDIGAICTDFAVLPDDNGFRFKVCDCGETSTIIHPHAHIAIPCDIHPTIMIKQVKSKKYLMYIEHDNYGAIVDTITTGNALLGAGSSSLNAMIKRYGFQDDSKEIINDYSEKYNKAMYSYAMQDVMLTVKLLSAQYNLYRKHDIPKPFYLVMSEASIGKAYNDKLGVPPFKSAHNEIGQWLYSIANMGYYGGRSEANLRRKPTLVRYADFKSEYPLVNRLIRSQRFLLANYIRVEKCGDLVREMLEKIQLNDLRDMRMWEELTILVKIRTNGDILPYKEHEKSVTNYGQKVLYNTVGWYSLLDVVASYIRTNHIPEIIEAYRLVPNGNINTNKIHVLSNEDFSIDLDKDDFFVKVIDLRDSVKQEIKQIKKQLKSQPANESDLLARKSFLDNLQLALKLMANSTSYGILVETREINRTDIAGKYNAQPIGIHITAGARLLLAIAEKLGMDRGISYALCDTDSFAYAKPDDMSKEEFYNKVNECITWFNSLSPYASSDEIFELEDVNKWNDEDTELFALCISAKRYVLYNKVPCEPYEYQNKIVTWKPRIRKLSEHGLPFFLFDMKFPLPSDVLQPVNNMWKPDRYLMWYYGILSAELSLPLEIPLDSWSNQPVYKQISITTPHIYNWFPYIPEIRPFSFFCVTPQSKHKSRKQRYYFPYAKHAKYIQVLIQKGLVKIIGDTKTEYHPQFDLLYERFLDFFSHEERKANNGKEDGYMERKEINGSTIEIRTRSGKKIKANNYATLWDSLETESEI
jgi:hypothetical protein